MVWEIILGPILGGCNQIYSRQEILINGSLIIKKVSIHLGKINACKLGFGQGEHEALKWLYSTSEMFDLNWETLF
jgi:hypothetical protein